MKYILLIFLAGCAWQGPKINNDPVIDDCMDVRTSEFLQDHQLSELDAEVYCGIKAECEAETGKEFQTHPLGFQCDEQNQEPVDSQLTTG